MLSYVCFLDAFLLFDESKGGEKLNKLKLDKIENWKHFRWI